MSLVILGSGLAGYMLAKEWRKLDSSTPLEIVTADDGSFYSKPLLSTALTQKKIPEQLIIKNVDAMAEELNAKIYTHQRVSSIQTEQYSLFCSSHQINFSHLVLACGASVVRPILAGNASTEVLAVNSLQDYKVFRQWLVGKKTIAIMGAGLVGCEFANDLINAGYQVTVIAPEAYPLNTWIPAAVGNLLQKALAQQGVNWQLGHIVTAIDRTEKSYQVSLSNGKSIFVDGVFSAIGLRPQLSLAKQAGIAINRGIKVNRWLQTNFSNIFALGDCAEVDGRIELYVAPLLQCARALAKILIGGKEPVHYPSMPVVVKTPAFPLVFSAPPDNVVGEWYTEEDGLRALFHDAEGQLRGFALVGDKIRDKMTLAKQLPIIFSE